MRGREEVTNEEWAILELLLRFDRQTRTSDLGCACDSELDIVGFAHLGAVAGSAGEVSSIPDLPLALPAVGAQQAGVFCHYRWYNNYAGNSEAIYLRTHKREQFLLVSIAIGVLTACGTLLMGKSRRARRRDTRLFLHQRNLWSRLRDLHLHDQAPAVAQDLSLRGSERSMTEMSQSSGQPLLSFAIPTYNRAKHLDRLLGVLLKQLHGESRVEVIVSDNASTDNTPAVVEDFRQQGLPIRYNRNEANLGPDANIIQCHERAAGQYVWIFGDDDLIAPGTMKRVLDALSLQLYDLVCIRAYAIEGEYVQHKHFIPAPDLDLARAEDLARHVHVFFTFISGIIVNKERISSVPHRPFDSLLNTNLGQLGPCYTALNHHRRSLLIRDPLIAGTGNNNVGYALFHIFGTNLARITCEWIDRISVQRAIINGTIQTFFPLYILLIRQSKFSSASENPHQVLRSCCGKNFRYWVFDYPIYALPLSLARIWLLIVRAINKIDRLLGSPLLRF